jgi:hypothetical protein
MDFELITKIVALGGSVYAFYKKIIVDFGISKKSQLREEFTFIKEFITDLKSDTHPFLIEKGYYAITGDSSLTAKEIIYLLSLPSPAQALKKYSISRYYIEFKEATPDKEARVVFRYKYTKRYRKWIKVFHILVYIFFAVLAVTPVLFAKDIFGTNLQAAFVFIPIALISFGSLAYQSVAEYGRILRGEELVDMK